MTNLWLKIKVWTKITITVIVLLYVLAFVLNNSGQSVEIWYWFFAAEVKTPLIVFAFITFAVGVLLTLLVRAFFKTMRQIREIRDRNRTAKLEKQVSDMQSKAAMLKTRETTPGTSTTAPSSGEGI